MNSDIKAFIEAWEYTPEEKKKIQQSEDLNDLLILAFIILVLI